MPVLTVRDKQILYIHVPKTGGTTVEHLLRSYGGSLWFYSPRRTGLPCTPQHFHGRLLKTVFSASGATDGREHAFDFVFMTVRHPISRLLSEYRYQRNLMSHHEVGDERPELWRRVVGSRHSVVARTLSFDIWCRYALLRYSQNSTFLDNHLRPQVEFAAWNPVVYRLEDGLDTIRKQLDEVIGVPGSLPAERRKVSTACAGSPEELRPSTRRRIYDYYSRDFSAYGYGFDL